MDLSHYKGVRPLNSILPSLKGIKVRKVSTLFPPTLDMSNLQKGNCPACNRKLKALKRQPLYICGRKTCPATIDKDSFAITEAKLMGITNLPLNRK